MHERIQTITEKREAIKILLGTLLLVYTVLGLESVSAQTDNSMQGMDDSQMVMEDLKTDDQRGMSAMDHSSMQMQGGLAPADARDPHAYSDGQTRRSGDYILPGVTIMRMADEHNMFSFMVDRLERVDNPGQNSTAYDVMAGYGSDYNKLVIKSEGDVANGKLEEASTDALWSHAIATFWDAQLGMRYDSGAGMPNRSWLAAGVQGLAPYWFEIDVTAYLGENGRTALSFEAEYELLMTQKLVLQPRLEASLYSKSEPARNLGKGLSDMIAGIRLRYEIRREFAPYIGVEYTSKYGDTADIARALGTNVSDTRMVVGLRFWY